MSNGLAIGGLLPGEVFSLISTNISISIHYYVILYYVNPSLVRECTPTYAYKDICMHHRHSETLPPPPTDTPLGTFNHLLTNI